MADANGNGIDDSLEPKPSASPSAPAVPGGVNISPEIAAQFQANMAGVGQALASADWSFANPGSIWSEAQPGIRTGVIPPGAAFGPGGAYLPKPGGEVLTETPEEIMKKWYSDEGFQQKWADRMRTAGWVSEDADAFTVANAFVQFVAEAGAYTQAGSKKDLDGIYKMLAEENEDALAKAKAQAAASQPRLPQVGDTTTNKSRTESVDLTNPTTAKRLVNEILAQALGQDASDAQFNSFLSTLHQAQRENPTVTDSTQTRTITNVDEDGVDYADTNRSTQTGGVDEAQIAIDYARTLPEYKRFQASTTFMDAFMGAIRNPVGA